jgi:2-isopropylmalate synthase
MSLPFWKYPRYATEAFPLVDRQWPDRELTEHPIWCSTDLRDGNQALVRPMDIARKRRMFDLLCEIGMKEIEAGFPSASRADFDFLRSIIESNAIPDDVTIAVLTPAREELIERTFEAIDGAPRCIVHLYNSTSTAQRRVVFRMSRDEIAGLALTGVRQCRELADAAGQSLRFEYTPESFDGTEDDFALELCEAVLDEWGPREGEKVILNLPTTVERFMPNVYADRIEWFARNFSRLESVILSIHPHNDRGTAVATAELGLLAGGQRVEGTLFGNGERTGNVDLITVALNLHVQGIDCGLDLSEIDRIKARVEECNEMPVPARHPYAGELVYTAFSGSHQDAISKGLYDRERRGATDWDVPYLPIDPMDLGRAYEAVIRVNSQSGKGGVGHTMASAHSFELPRALLLDFAPIVQAITDASGDELSPADMKDVFVERYFDSEAPLKLITFTHAVGTPDTVKLEVEYRGAAVSLQGQGNGPIDALVDAIRGGIEPDVAIVSYHEHSMGRSASATAAAYIEGDIVGSRVWGVATEESTMVAAVKAVVAAFNRALTAQPGRPTPMAQAAPRLP